LYFSALLALLAALPASSPAAAVKWQLVPENGSASPAAAPVYTPVPKTDSQSNPQTESVTTAAPRWQRLDDPASSTTPIRWAEAPQTTTTPTTPAVPKQITTTVKPIARSVGRAFSYAGALYPEVGFWVPTAFRQDVARRFVLTYQLLGNPTNTSSPDAPNWNDFWNVYSDGQYLAEFNPLIIGPISAGITFSQQESFVGSRSDGDYRNSGASIGFQIKSSLTPTTGFAIVGQNQEQIFSGTGGPNGRYPSNGSNIQADLGRSYLFIASQSIPLGNWFGAKTPAVATVTAGAGNGRYKPIDETRKYWVNYGSYGPIGTVSLAFNQRISIFAEWAGQYNGFGMSFKPFERIPVTGTFMLRDFQGVHQGIVNCQGGNPNNCRPTIDSRITISF
jgi:hypothetical protein